MAATSRGMQYSHGQFPFLRACYFVASVLLAAAMTDGLGIQWPAGTLDQQEARTLAAAIAAAIKA
jgi:hypothetical protein